MKPILKYKIVDGKYVDVAKQKHEQLAMQQLPQSKPEHVDEQPIVETHVEVAAKHKASIFENIKNSISSFFNGRFSKSTETKIPKHIYMVWIGDKVPEYALFAKKAYEKMNPKFKVSLLHYTVDDVLDGNDPIMQKAAQAVIDTKMGLPGKYYDFIRRYIDEHRTFCQTVANMFRFILLEEKGGIYVDCDTLPIKPFNDALLEKAFTTKVKAWRSISKSKGRAPENAYEDYLYGLDYRENSGDYMYYEYQDIFFFGFPKGGQDVSYGKYMKIKGDVDKNVFIRNNDNLEEFNKLRDMFFKCDNRIYKHLNDIEWTSYIVHFKDRTWLRDNAGNIRSPRCLIDEIDSYSPPKWIDRACKQFIDYGFSKYDVNLPNANAKTTLMIYTSPDEVPDRYRFKATANNCQRMLDNQHRICKAMLKIAASVEM